MNVKREPAVMRYLVSEYDGDCLELLTRDDHLQFGNGGEPPYDDCDFDGLSGFVVGTGRIFTRHANSNRDDESSPDYWPHGEYDSICEMTWRAGTPAEAAECGLLFDEAGAAPTLPEDDRLESRREHAARTGHTHFSSTERFWSCMACGVPTFGYPRETAAEAREREKAARVGVPAPQPTLQPLDVEKVQTWLAERDFMWLEAGLSMRKQIRLGKREEAEAVVATFGVPAPATSPDK